MIKIYCIVFLLLFILNGCTTYYDYIFLSCKCESYKFSHSSLEISIEGIYSFGANNSLYSAVAINVKNFGENQLDINIENINLESENYNHKLVNSSIRKEGNKIDVVLEFYADYNKRSLSLFPDTKTEILSEIVSLNLKGIYLNSELIEINEIKMRAESNN